MAQIMTCFNLKMKDEEQINKALEILETAIEKSDEDENITDQIGAFLEEMQNSIDENIIEVEECFDLSQYAYEVLFPDWFKAIAKEFPNSNFKAEAVQESYTDGSNYEYKASYSKGILSLERHLKGYINADPICEGVIGIDELKNFSFELNGIKEQPALKPKEVNEKPGLTVNNGTLKKYVGDTVDFVVPDNITAIGAKAFNNCSSLKRLHISANVVKIASDALVDCNNLEEITVSEENGVYHSINNCLIQKSNKKLILGCKGSIIPTDGSVKTIGARAFALGQPDSIYIPKSVTKIEDKSLICTGLKYITVEDGNKNYHSAGNCLIETESKKLILGCANSVIPDDGSVVEIDNQAFSGCDIVEIVIPNKVKKLGLGKSEFDVQCGEVFKGCKQLKHVIIGNGLTKVEFGEFENCDCLESVVLGNRVKAIGSGAFKGCSKLKSIVFPKGLKEIGGQAFEGCASLTNITIPDGVTEIGSKAFRNCIGLTSVTIPTSVKWIEEETFSGCGGLTTLSIPDSVESVGVNAFKGCVKLVQTENGVHYVDKWAIGCDNSVSQVVLRSNTQGIGGAAFIRCKGLKSIEIPDRVKNICFSAFEGCKGLVKVSLGNGVMEIAGAAFKGCSNLSSIVIPDSVTEIGFNAFEECSSLVNVFIPESVKIISLDAFKWCENLTIYCEPESKPATWSTYGWSEVNWGVKDRSIVKNFSEFVIEDGILKKYQGKRVLITIPDEVTSIADLAFADCKTIEEVIIPNSVTMIGEEAFNGCSFLKKITIPESVSSIGEGAFYGCDEIASIDVNKDNVKYKTMDGDLYSKDGAHLIRVLAGKKRNLFVIPNNVIYIDKYAFHNCRALKEIIMPEGVTIIEEGAFNGCESLKTINISESVSTIGAWAFNGCKTLKSLNIPMNVKSIDGRAFYQCDSLTRINVSEKNVSFECVDGVLFSKDKARLIKYFSFNKNKVYSIPVGVISIDAYAFSGNSELTEINIPNTVKEIGDCALFNCSSLLNLFLPDSVVTIGEGALCGCKTMQSIEVSENNTNFKCVDGVLYSKDGTRLIQCPAGIKVTSINISDDVEVIGKFAFVSCSSLEKIIISKGVISIEESVFLGCSWFKLKIYCEAEEKPNGWENGWNSDYPVIWGYKGE